jgi:hypothetical protein
MNSPELIVRSDSRLLPDPASSRQTTVSLERPRSAVPDAAEDPSPMVDLVMAEAARTDSWLDQGAEVELDERDAAEQDDEDYALAVDRLLSEEAWRRAATP